LSPVTRQNGWPLAEHLGERTPDGVQRLLNAADWDADAVLIGDEAGFLKKGRHLVGVQRQYSGTAGRIENCQVGVFLGHARRHGAAFLDRALYLPKDWAADPVRRTEAHVPEAVTFRTRPTLVLEMIERALDAGGPCRWVIGDEVYGGDRTLRFRLEQRGQPFVGAVTCNEPLWRDGRSIGRPRSLPLSGRPGRGSPWGGYN
jgi:SRSO17 transposase